MTLSVRSRMSKVVDMWGVWIFAVLLVVCAICVFQFEPIVENDSDSPPLAASMRSVLSDTQEFMKFIPSGSKETVKAGDVIKISAVRHQMYPDLVSVHTGVWKPIAYEVIPGKSGKFGFSPVNSSQTPRPQLCITKEKVQSKHDKQFRWELKLAKPDKSVYVCKFKVIQKCDRRECTLTTNTLGGGSSLVITFQHGYIEMERHDPGYRLDSLLIKEWVSPDKYREYEFYPISAVEHAHDLTPAHGVFGVWYILDFEKIVTKEGKRTEKMVASLVKKVSKGHEMERRWLCATAGEGITELVHVRREDKDKKKQYLCAIAQKGIYCETKSDVCYVKIGNTGVEVKAWKQESEESEKEREKSEPAMKEAKEEGKGIIETEAS